MTIGIIGFGSIGERHYKNLLFLNYSPIVLSGRTDIQVAHQVKTWADFETAGPYDAIFICNETAKHLETIKKCLTLKPSAIFVEKPLSHNSHGLKELQSKLARAHINIWVGYNFHFFKPFLEIKKILDSKKLGRIYFMRISVGQDLREWRKRDYKKSYSTKKEQGGGVMLDLVHDINYPAWLLGEEIIPVTGTMRKLSKLAINTEDCAESIFMSKRSRVMISVHQDYLRIIGKRTLEIVGDRGVLSWDSVGDSIILETATAKSEEKISVDRNEMYQAEVKFFIDNIISQKRFSNIAEATLDIKSIEYLKKNQKNEQK